jgi:hypothetical protein
MRTNLLIEHRRHRDTVGRVIAVERHDRTTLVETVPSGTRWKSSMETTPDSTESVRNARKNSPKCRSSTLDQPSRLRSRNVHHNASARDYAFTVFGE